MTTEFIQSLGLLTMTEVWATAEKTVLATDKLSREMMPTWDLKKVLSRKREEVRRVWSRKDEVCTALAQTGCSAR